MSTPARDLANRFAYHPPKNKDIREAHERVRELCLDLATRLDHNLPDSREKALALTKLEESMFWANAAIARISNPIDEGN